MSAPRTDKGFARYWLLHELRRVRAQVRNGSTTAPKERKALQRDLAKLRKG